MPDVPIQKLLESSDLVFKGTVVQLHASTLPNVPARENSIVVRVDQGLRVAPVLGDLNGRLITVLTKDVDKLKVEQQAIFLTSSWIHGNSIATREVTRLDADATGEKTIKEGVAALPELRVQERVAMAELVVVGQVESIERARNMQEFTSRHSPQWMTANIRVESVAKGNLNTDYISVIFPSSRDHMWSRSPKFQEGQSGIFILHRGGTPLAPLQALTALDPADFQQRNMLSSVEKFVGPAN